jgi:hypothetical protein
VAILTQHTSAFSLYPTVDPVSLASALNISTGCLDALYVILLPSNAKLMSTEIPQLHAMTTYLAGQTSWMTIGGVQIISLHCVPQLV